MYCHGDLYIVPPHCPGPIRIVIGTERDHYRVPNIPNQTDLSSRINSQNE